MADFIETPHGRSRGCSSRGLTPRYDIALHTGCRLREARLPLNCIDFAENKITFPSPKGGEERAFSIPMPTALRSLFESLRGSKKRFTLEFPFQPSRRWQQFFIKIKKEHLCFHCLRVVARNCTKLSALGFVGPASGSPPAPTRQRRPAGGFSRKKLAHRLYQTLGRQPDPPSATPVLGRRPCPSPTQK